MKETAMFTRGPLLLLHCDGLPGACGAPRAPSALLRSVVAALTGLTLTLAEVQTDDCNSGAAVIGTGPFKLASCRPRESSELARNDAYWGAPEPWETVSLRLLPNAYTR